MRKLMILQFIMLILSWVYPEVYAWDNKLTHPDLTEKAINRSILCQNFLELELWLESGMKTELTNELEDDIDRRVSNESEKQNRPNKWKKGSAQTLIDWLIDGSMYEDTPNPRARHHFYNPLINDPLGIYSGLDNYAVTPSLIRDIVCLGSLKRYPNYLPTTFQGDSSLKTALGDGIVWIEAEPIGPNRCVWPAARQYYEMAVISESEETRNKEMASSFFILGHICHLLEDTGVPAHARNDFTWGHLVAGLPKMCITTKEWKWPWDGGNPFEAWVEKQVKSNRGEIPNRWMDETIGNIPSHSKIADYWDKGICEESGTNQWQGHNDGWPDSGFGISPPLTGWGLAETTNYQFLSYSTYFKDDGSNQVYPHPARANTREYSENNGTYYKDYLGGYGVPRLAKITYTSYSTGLYTPAVTIKEDCVSYPKVWEDYANITIPRTINYTTGLINYFFRGRLDVSAYYDPQAGKVIITIQNLSDNSGIPQILHNGEFTLYWENENGSREPVNPAYYTIYEPSGTSTAWSQSSTLNCTQSTTGHLDPNFIDKYLNESVKQYLLLYKGGISVNPASPDPDDEDAIAAKTFEACMDCLVAPPTIEDLRKKIALATLMNNAILEGTEFGAINPQNPLRFAQSFQDFMLPYATAVATNWGADAISRPHQPIRPGSYTVWFEDSFSSSISGVEFGTEAKGEFIILNCTPKNVNGIYNRNTVGYLTPEAESWYKEEDDWRPGTPFIITNCDDARNNGFYRVRGRTMVGSTLYVSVDDNNHTQQELVACTSGTMECSFGGEWWTLRGDNGNCSATYMSIQGQNISSYLASNPDTQYAGTVRNRWWTSKDQYHRYAGDVRGPHDGRPPSGGYMAADFNGDWVRGINPSLYHCYDKNSHRFSIRSDLDMAYPSGPYQQWVHICEANQFLPVQTDPKEQVSPWFCRDTKSARWKYGSGVPFAQSQITNPATLGAIQGCFQSGYITVENNWINLSNDRQYGSVIVEETVKYNGDLPATTSASRSRWLDGKYDEAIQNMTELAIEKLDWHLPVDSAYKQNWFDLYHPAGSVEDYIPLALEFYLYDGQQSGTVTYQSAYGTFGLNAYNPTYDHTAPAFAELHDELWGENCSAFELILKILGPSYYDWYYDNVTPFCSRRILGIRAEMNSERYNTFFDYPWPQIHNEIECANREVAINAYLPLPVGTWRRTWKRTFGRVRDCYMRDGSREEPAFHIYSDYANYPDTGNPEVFMPGHHRMTHPDNTDFYTWSETDLNKSGNTITLAGDKTNRFKPGWIVWSAAPKAYPVLNASYHVAEGETVVTLGGDFGTDSVSALYGDTNLSANHDAYCSVEENPYVWRILNDCKRALELIKYKYIDVSIAFVQNFIDVGSSGGPFSSIGGLLAAYQQSYNEQWNSNILEWDGIEDDDWPRYEDKCENVGIILPFCKYPIDGLWRSGETASPSYSEMGIIFSVSNHYSKDGVSILLRLSVRQSRPLDSSWKKSDTLLSIQEYGIVSPPPFWNPSPPPAINHFQHIYLSVSLESNEVKTIRICSFGDFSNMVYCFGNNPDPEQDAPVWVTDTGVQITPKILGGTSVLVQFDWKKFSDSIWQRLKERADYLLIDPFGPDTNPPVVTNAWEEKPAIYDASFPSYGSELEEFCPYDWDDYVPIYKIRSKLALMEDMEGLGVNEVDYIITFSGSEYAESLSFEGPNRKMDVILDLDTDPTPGGNLDAWKAYDEGIAEWSAVANSKDNANSRGNPADNYGIPADPAEITFDENLPMFPVKARIHMEKIQVNSVWYDHVWVDEPICLSPLKYRLERWDKVLGYWGFLYDFDDTNPAPPEGGETGDNHFYISGEGITEVSENYYRIRCKNHYTGKNGMYSDPSAEVKGTLRITNPYSLTGITVDGDPVASFPYEVKFTLGTTVTLYCGDSQFQEQEWKDIGRAQSFYGNPVDVKLNKDYNCYPWR